MGNIENDPIDPNSENTEDAKIPTVLEPLENADKIKYLLVDADNNLWDWVAMHAEGMHRMACELCTVTGIAYEDIQASMKRVYKAAKTLDFSNLVESMDIIQAYASAKAETIMLEDVEATRKARAVMQSNIVAELVIVAKKAYDKNRKKNFDLYPGVLEVFQQIADHRKDIQIIILTDAPYHKTIQRILMFGLAPYVTKMFAQVQKKLRFEDDVEFEPGQEYLRPFFEAIKATIPHKANYSQQALVSSGALRTPFQVVVMDEGERKPGVKHHRRLGITEEEAHEQVMVWGDNALKDGGQACGIYIPNASEKKEGKQIEKTHNAEAKAYAYSEYGQSNAPRTVELLTGFGSTQEVSRNLSDGSVALEELKQTQEALIEQQIQKHRTEIKEIVHTVQFCDLLNIPRPAKYQEAA